MNSLALEHIVPTATQVSTLYDLLKARRHSISHAGLPSYAEHSAFVFNNPYRHWYLVSQHGPVLGSIYVQFDNSVGINFVRDIESDELSSIIVSLRELVKPLEPLPSLRFADFFINVPHSDTRLQSCLERIGYTPAQVGYVQHK